MSSNIKILSVLLIIINDFYLVAGTNIISQILRLSKSAQGKTAAGQVVNLLSNDVNRFDFVTLFLHFVWITPIQTTVITYFIWEAVGWSALIGVLAIFLQTVPVQSKFLRITIQFTLLYCYTRFAYHLTQKINPLIIVLYLPDIFQTGLNSSCSLLSHSVM